MKPSKFNEAQIIGILRDAEAGAKTSARDIAATGSSARPSLMKRPAIGVCSTLISTNCAPSDWVSTTRSVSSRVSVRELEATFWGRGGELQ